MAGVEKVFAAVLIKVVLLGGAGGPPIAWQDTSPGLPSPPRSAAAVGGGRSVYELTRVQTLEGEKVVQEPAAGLTVVMGPNEERLQALFGEVERDESCYQEATVEAEAGEVRGERAAWIWPERQFEFARPESRRAYYLEQVEEDLYRRAPLPETEGHVVTVRLDSSPNTYEAEVEFCGRRLHGGEYDEALRAFVGRPVVSKTSVTAFARFKPGQPVLLLWQGEPLVGESVAHLRRSAAYAHGGVTAPVVVVTGTPLESIELPPTMGAEGPQPGAAAPEAVEPSDPFAPRRSVVPMESAPAVVTPGLGVRVVPRQMPASGIAVLLEVKEQAAAD